MEILIQQIAESMNTLLIPVWKQWSYWLSFGISALGFSASVLAFIEARQAKKAANEAGRIVKIQTIIIELTEINQRIGNVQSKIDYYTAYNFFQEISRKLIRLLRPFSDEQDTYCQPSIKVIECLEMMQLQLSDLKPFNNSTATEETNHVFDSISDSLTFLSHSIAHLSGELEKITIDYKK